MRFFTTILVSFVALVLAIDEKCSKRCESVNKKLINCNLNSNSDSVHHSDITCLCKLDKDFFSDYVYCVKECTRPADSIPKQYESPKALKQYLCSLDSQISESTVTSTRVTLPGLFSSKTETNSNLESTTKNSAPTLSGSIIALLAIALL